MILEVRILKGLERDFAEVFIPEGLGASLGSGVRGTFGGGTAWRILNTRYSTTGVIL